MSEPAAQSISLWRQIVAAALLGSERQPNLLPETGGSLAKFVAAAQANRERTLLAAGAAVSLYNRAGRVPPRDAQSPPEPCDIEDLPRLKPRAAQHLALMLDGRHSNVLPECLGLATAAGRRVPEEYLPPLLELGRSKPGLRKAVVAVLGKRGLWLAAQNSDWDYAAGGFDEAVWQTETRAARLSFLRSLRDQDPARARELLAQTWNEETPEDRAAFLAELKTGLSLQDEPFLEAALDDRRKDVRRAAAELLSRLPGSQLCARMIRRVLPLLALKEKGRSRRLGLVRVSGLHLEVSLPESCARDIIRDGIEKTPPPQVGQRAWWLIQMLASVPPSVWPQTWNETPADLLHAAAESEWKQVLFEGWERAALTSRDAQWAEAFIAVYAPQKELLPRVTPLFEVIPVERKGRLARDLLRSEAEPFGSGHPVFWMLKEWQGPWGLELSREVLARLRERAASEVDYPLSRVLGDFAVRLAPALAEEAASGWPEHSERWPLWAPAVSGMVSTLRFRSEMLKEIQQ